MPKIVSRSAVSSSTEAAITESAQASLKTYYCLCGEFALVINKDISKLPRRTTDGAIIIRCEDTPTAKAQIFKMNVNFAPPVFIERSNGHERQYRMLCTRCTLTIAYQITPAPIKSSPFVYLNYGAVTQQQGNVPPEAFEGENEAHLALKDREASEITAQS